MHDSPHIFWENYPFANSTVSAEAQPSISQFWDVDTFLNYIKFFDRRILEPWNCEMIGQRRQLVFHDFSIEVGAAYELKGGKKKNALCNLPPRIVPTLHFRALEACAMHAPSVQISLNRLLLLLRLPSRVSGNHLFYSGDNGTKSSDPACSIIYSNVYSY